MIRLSFALTVACVVVGSAHQSAPCPPATSAAPPNATQPAFAMRSYFVAFLKRGPAWTAAETPEVREVSKGHMANIEALAKSGKLVLAGPFDVPADQREAIAGIFVLDVKTIEEARAAVDDDPAVKTGRFTVEIWPWYGPAGITYPGDESP